MKIMASVLGHQLRGRAFKRNLKSLGQLLLVMAVLVAVFSLMFHVLMAWEGRDYSWFTGVYWTMTVMSTLGLGDITFQSDLGKMFSIVVLLSGTFFMLILLPFTFIQFFYAPWIEAQVAAIAPRELPSDKSGHVILTAYGPVEMALIPQLVSRRYPYVVLVHDTAEALRLHDLGVDVMVGERDDPQTYHRLRLQQAALLAATNSDIINTNVAFTARSVAPNTPIVATAQSEASVDILRLAGCTRVLQLADMMGRGLARRVTGRDAKSHVIGRFGKLLIAEASAAGTPLVDRTLEDIRLPDHASVNVVGVWERGVFNPAGPQTVVSASTVLLLAGTREQLDEYDTLFCIYSANDNPVVIIGGGRVGRACADALVKQNIDYRILEKVPKPSLDPDRVVEGDAADLEVLHRAGLMESPAVVITTHDDDINVYLTIYCRRLRSDIQIISRSTAERNVDTLHRAGADFVMSYASMGANALFNLLLRDDVLLVTEGLNVLEVPVPPSLGGQTLGQSDIRATTGCHVVAIEIDGEMRVNPGPDSALPLGARMVLIGSEQAEQEFLERFVTA
jgi:voltage-gated potassium channel